MIRTARPVTALAIAAGTAVLTALALLTGIGAQPASGTDPVHKLLYAVLRPACARPANPAAFRCFAIRRVLVAKGTPGASAVADVGRGPEGGYTPRQLAVAYGYNASSHRSDVTVGIVDWDDDPKVLTDLNAFDAHYGFAKETAHSFRKVNQDGHSSPLPPHRESGSVSEIALDVQAVRAVCHTCRILLVEARAPANGDIARAENTAVRLGADVVSNSFGGGERGIGPVLRRSFDHPGVVITASTGDDGWNDFDQPAQYRSTPAAYPATDPHVVSVGGTDLVLDKDGTIHSEQVWNENPTASSGSGQGASGSGCSVTFDAPGWQAHHTGYSAAHCHGRRLAADISAIADPMHGFDIRDTDLIGGWGTVGGTSLSAPVIAAMFALGGHGSGGAAYPAATLYTNRGHRPHSIFDVHHGANAFCGDISTATCSTDAAGLLGLQSNNPNASGRGLVDCSFPRNDADISSVPAKNPECNAVRGYDGPSGLGAPRGLGAFVPTNPTVSISRPTSVRHGSRALFTGHVHKRLPQTSVRFTWTWGDGRVSHTRSASIHHEFRRSGHYSVELTVTDSRYQETIERTTVAVS